MVLLNLLKELPPDPQGFLTFILLNFIIFANLSGMTFIIEHFGIIALLTLFILIRLLVPLLFPFHWMITNKHFDKDFQGCLFFYYLVNFFRDYYSVPWPIWIIGWNIINCMAHAVYFIDCTALSPRLISAIFLGLIICCLFFGTKWYKIYLINKEYEYEKIGIFVQDSFEQGSFIKHEENSAIKLLESPKKDFGAGEELPQKSRQLVPFVALEKSLKSSKKPFFVKVKEKAPLIKIIMSSSGIFAIVIWMAFNGDWAFNIFVVKFLTAFIVGSFIFIFLFLYLIPVLFAKVKEKAPLIKIIMSSSGIFAIVIWMASNGDWAFNIFVMKFLTAFTIGSFIFVFLCLFLTPAKNSTEIPTKELLIVAKTSPKLRKPKGERARERTTMIYKERERQRFKKLIKAEEEAIDKKLYGKEKLQPSMFYVVWAKVNKIEEFLVTLAFIQKIFLMTFLSVILYMFLYPSKAFTFICCGIALYIVISIVKYVIEYGYGKR
jgi:hypothetical protein